MKFKKLFCILTSSMLIGVLSYSVFAVNDVIVIDDNNESWSKSTNIDLFDVSSNGEKILYPGINGKYSFSIVNNDTQDKNCSISIKGINDYSIPLKVRVLHNDNYVIGNKEEWGNNLIYDDTLNISSNDNNIYTIEWKWDYYSSDEKDMIDTSLGIKEVSEVQPYVVNINTYVVDDLSTDSSDESSYIESSIVSEDSYNESSFNENSKYTENTGDNTNVNIMLSLIFIIISTICICGLCIGRRRE